MCVLSFKCYMAAVIETQPVWCKDNFGVSQGSVIKTAVKAKYNVLQHLLLNALSEMVFKGAIDTVYRTKLSCGLVLLSLIAPRRYGSNFKSIIFKLIAQNNGSGDLCEIVIELMLPNLTTAKSALVQVMFLCYQVISNYLIQC